MINNINQSNTNNMARNISKISKSSFSLFDQFNKLHQTRKPHKKRIPTPKFLSILNQILSDSKNFETISWNESGNVIIIKDKDRFIENILPFYFSHQNMSSFIRQLNKYDFKKNRKFSNKGLIAYSNIFFLRDHHWNVRKINTFQIKKQGQSKKNLKGNEKYFNMNNIFKRGNDSDKQQNIKKTNDSNTDVNNLESMIHYIIKQLIPREVKDKLINEYKTTMDYNRLTYFLNEDNEESSKKASFSLKSPLLNTVLNKNSTEKDEFNMLLHILLCKYNDYITINKKNVKKERRMFTKTLSLDSNIFSYINSLTEIKSSFHSNTENLKTFLSNEKSSFKNASFFFDFTHLPYNNFHSFLSEKGKEGEDVGKGVFSFFHHEKK